MPLFLPLIRVLFRNRTGILTSSPLWSGPGSRSRRGGSQSMSVLNLCHSSYCRAVRIDILLLHKEEKNLCEAEISRIYLYRCSCSPCFGAGASPDRNRDNLRFPYLTRRFYTNSTRLRRSTKKRTGPLGMLNLSMPHTTRPAAAHMRT